MKGEEDEKDKLFKSDCCGPSLLLAFSTSPSSRFLLSLFLCQNQLPPGEAIVERASDLGVESAEVNFALSNGDKILIENGLVELSFGRNNF